MNAEQARERSKKAATIPFQKKCIEPNHYLMGWPQNTCVDCLATHFLTFRKEGLEAAIEVAMDHSCWAEYCDCRGKIVQTIRELEKE